MSDSTGWKKIGVVGVDSGQLMIVDPCYIDSEWKKEGFVPKKDAGANQPIKGLDLNDNVIHNFSYNAVCRGTADGRGAVQLHYQKGHSGVAVAFASGFGDGEYDVYGHFVDCGDWGIRLAEVKIVLIPDSLVSQEEEEKSDAHQAG